MKAAVYQGKQRFEIQDVPMPQPGPGQVLVKVEYCGICGTDVHGFMFDVIEPGSIVGHEVSGTVVEVGSEITRWKVGDRVAGGGGEKPPGTPDRIEDDPRFNYRTMGWIDMPARAHSYAEYVTMDEWEPVLIPEGVADIEAAMTEPLATSILAVRRSGIKLGDTVGVLGAGPIGLFCVQAARAAGASTVIVAEPAEARAKAALERGRHRRSDHVRHGRRDGQAHGRTRTESGLRLRGSEEHFAGRPQRGDAQGPGDYSRTVLGVHRGRTGRLDSQRPGDDDRPRIRAGGLAGRVRPDPYRQGPASGDAHGGKRHSAGGDPGGVRQPAPAYDADQDGHQTVTG